MSIPTVFTPVSEALKDYADLLANETPNTVKGTAKPKIVKAEPLVRPNGELYFPRAFMDSTDAAFIQKAYDEGLPVLLYGPPGTGKTALVEAVFPHCITVMGTAETEASDFLGSWVQRDDGNYEWIDGPLVRACENGIPLLIDEIALIDSRSLAVVYSVMDGRRKFPVTMNPARGEVEAQPGFAVFGCCNPDVPGAIMSDALLSRFAVHIEVGTDWAVAAGPLHIDPKIINAAKNLQEKYDAGQVLAAPQLRELINFRNIAAAFGEEAALRNFVSSARAEDRDIYVSVVTAVFDRKTVKALTL